MARLIASQRSLLGLAKIIFFFDKADGKSFCYVVYESYVRSKWHKATEPIIIDRFCKSKKIYLPKFNERRHFEIRQR